LILKRLQWCGAALVLSVLAGCAAGPNPQGGLLYTSIKGPNHVVDEKVDRRKQAEACAANVLGYIAFGDASIAAAKKKGGIVQVSTVDYSEFSILGVLYKKTCTIVSGIGGKDEKESKE
jgi:TRL-like protein family